METSISAKRENWNINNILYYNQLIATLGYITFVSLFVAEIAVASTHWATISQLQAWQIVLLGLAAFRGGIAVSENGVFKWLREPFCVTEPDSTAAGDSVNPRYNGGIMGVIGACLSCPICTLTHIGSACIAIYALSPHFGLLLIYGLGIAGIGELLYGARETLFWAGRHSREQCKHN